MESGGGGEGARGGERKRGREGGRRGRQREKETHRDNGELLLILLRLALLRGGGGGARLLLHNKHTHTGRGARAHPPQARRRTTHGHTTQTGTKGQDTHGHNAPRPPQRAARRTPHAARRTRRRKKTKPPPARDGAMAGGARSAVAVGGRGEGGAGVRGPRPIRAAGAELGQTRPAEFQATPARIPGRLCRPVFGPFRPEYGGMPGR